eukprot:CAMPEP_0182855444 /NCGR_PEP_ID=MMETSP0034_2-20130328/1844_1 /TAXON_ID=156128 /ORGANISM="Nephroselmis pyriformis, Strain CCMP717" /LENGTH=292 /DNA_ID=CAMNT_0024986403 /DNA_START=145 /DNA_END=1025 /DNA_ORIENTATION=-
MTGGVIEGLPGRPVDPHNKRNYIPHPAPSDTRRVRGAFVLKAGVVPRGGWEAASISLFKSSQRATSAAPGSGTLAVALPPCSARKFLRKVPQDTLAEPLVRTAPPTTWGAEACFIRARARAGRAGGARGISPQSSRCPSCGAALMAGGCALLDQLAHCGLDLVLGLCLPIGVLAVELLLAPLPEDIPVGKVDADGELDGPVAAECPNDLGLGEHPPYGLLGCVKLVAPAVSTAAVVDDELLATAGTSTGVMERRGRAQQEWGADTEMPPMMAISTLASCQMMALPNDNAALL